MIRLPETGGFQASPVGRNFRAHWALKPHVMDTSFPLLFAAFVGFTHAFEADHLLAVSNMATRRSKLVLAIKDGIFWGLGHTSTIFIIGMLMIVGKMSISEQAFGYFEAVVGLMLVALGLVRLVRVFQPGHTHEVAHDHSHNHTLAYSVGAVHGLAGSGALVVWVMGSLDTVMNGMLYLIIFGLGSVVGMLLASGVFSLPFSKKLASHQGMQKGLTLLSSGLCMVFGAMIIYKNLL